MSTKQKYVNIWTKIPHFAQQQPIWKILIPYLT